RGGLSETTRLSEWVRSLAWHEGADDELQFAIQLCLEEAVSNIIRHGYAQGSTEPITIELTQPRQGELVFTVEDFGPPFNPVLHPEMSPLDASGEPAIGGRGIRLLRAFAHALEYERTGARNCLRVGFSIARRQTSQP